MNKKIAQIDDAARDGKLMDSKQLTQLVDRIYALHEAEIDCQSCDEHLDCMAELTAAGYDPKLMLPAVQMHLDCCASCHEAFRALVCIVKAQQAGEC